MIPDGLEEALLSTWEYRVVHPVDSLCLTDVQGAANMLFITRSLLAGKGRPIRFQRQGQRKRAEDSLAAGLVADST